MSGSSPPLLEVSGLRVGIRRPDDVGDSPSELAAVDGIDLTIGRGEIFALVGESGSGKTASALALMGLLRGDAFRVGGRARFDGRDLRLGDDPCETRRLGRGMAMIFQEPMTSLNPLHRIGRQIAESADPESSNRRRLRGSAREAARRLLERVELTPSESRLDDYPHQLSGGQRQRAMIASALASSPRLLIADEPTTALDVGVQARILTLLRDLSESLSMAILLITHDLGAARRMATRIGVMSEGRLVETADSETLLSNPRSEEALRMLRASPTLSPPPPNPGGDVALAAEGVTVSYALRKGVLRRAHGERRAVDDVSFELRGGETLAAVGESGAGKTSLALALLRLIPSEGRIAWLGRDVSRLGARRLRPLRRDAQIVFQDPYGSLSPRMSVGDIVSEGLIASRRGSVASDERRRLALRALGDVGLDAESAIDRYPHEFSGGQRQRIALARALMVEPKALILDEPTSALDMSTRGEMIDLLLESQRRRGLAYLLIAHDLRAVRAMASKVMLMREGRVVEFSDADRFFASPSSAYGRSLLAASSFVEPPRAPARASAS